MDDEIRWVYHVTFYRNLDRILNEGLKPSGGSGINLPSHREHSKGKLFFSDFEDVDFWYNNFEKSAEAQSDNILNDGLVPIILAFPEPET